MIPFHFILSDNTPKIVFLFIYSLAANNGVKAQEIGLLWSQEFFIKKLSFGTREMTQRLRELTDRLEDPGSVSSIHVLVHDQPKCQFQEIWFPLLVSLGKQAYQWHTSRQNTHPHKITKCKTSLSQDQIWRISPQKWSLKWGPVRR